VNPLKVSGTLLGQVIFYYALFYDALFN